MAVAAHSQVEAVAGRGDVGDGGRDTRPAAAVHGDRADACAGGVVVVLQVGDATFEAGVEERALEGNELVALPAHDGHGTALAVEVAADVLVVFELAERRERLFPRPLVVAKGGPLVVVGGHAADGHRAVDGRGAAGHLAAREVDRTVRDGIGFELPVVVDDGHPESVLEVVGRLIDIGVVGSGLQQEDATVGVLAKPRSEGRAR